MGKTPSRYPCSKTSGAIIAASLSLKWGIGNRERRFPCNEKASLYSCAVKLLLAACLSAGTLGLISCANEGPTTQELQDRLGRGIRGEGQLTEGIDRSDDPYVKPRGGASL